jgi:hypothetical protein
MSVTVIRSAFASAQPQIVTLSQILSITNDGANPTYLIVSGLDRNEYTTSSTGATGTLTGNGATATFSAIGGDARGAGIVFTWDAATGSYQNATYGNLLDLAYTTSGSANDLTDLSFFGTNSSTWLGYAQDSATMAVNPQIWTNLGTASFATQSVGAPPAPSQATPGQVCSVAMRFVGDTWNMDGCWVLASTIDAEAGAALNVASDSAGTPGAANGEWKVAYDGTKGANANWQSLVRAGDQVAFITTSGGGHITTVVSGAGSSAMLVDNADFGINMVADGTGRDLTVMGPHAAWQEFNGVNASDVVVYRLDTPTVTLVTAADAATYGQSQAFSSLFAASDWAGTGITSYQAYDTSGYDSLSVNGVACTTAHSAGAAATCTSLAGLSFLAGSTTTTDTIEVRAQSASGYWGDWQALTVGVAAGAPATPPVLTTPTAAQTVYEGHAFSFTLPAATFTDPTATLAYMATQANGAALPGWLSFNPATLTFSGTAPMAAQSVSVRLTATNTGGASASETFTLTDRLDAPVLARQTAAQTAIGATAFSFSVPAGTFTDPLGEALTYTVSGANGAALPGWLSFNAQTLTFSGTAPAASATPTSIVLTATNRDGGKASETIALTVKAPPAPAFKAGTLSASAYSGQAVSIAAGTFADPSHQALTVTATLLNGQALPAWLHFNAGTDTLTGTAPATAGTTTIRLTARDAGGASTSAAVTITDKGADTPVLAHATAAPAGTAGQAVSLAIAANTFIDPLGEHLTYTVTQANGQALPSGLTWNAATDTLSGTCPITPGTLGLKVTATNSSGVSASELVSPMIRAAAGTTPWAGLLALLSGHPFPGPLGGLFAELEQLAMLFAAIGQTNAAAAFAPPVGALPGGQAGAMNWIAPATGAGSPGSHATATGAYGPGVAEAFGMRWGLWALHG